MMKYSFDDAWFGLTRDNEKLDERLARRPAGLRTQAWYKFASELASAMNKRMGLDNEA